MSGLNFFPYGKLEISGFSHDEILSIGFRLVLINHKAEQHTRSSAPSSSVQSFSHVRLLVTLWITARKASLSVTNSRSLPKLTSIEAWCHPNISSSVIPFSSCLQLFPGLGSFPTSHFLTSGGQNIGVSASASVLPMNTRDWSPLGWTGWISLQSKGLSRVFSNTKIQKHPFFCA